MFTCWGRRGASQAVCLSARGAGRHPVSCQSCRWPRTRAQLTQHQERLCPGLWVAAEEILQGGWTRGPPVVSSYCTQPVILILWSFSNNLSHDYEQVNRANTESILLMFSLGCGCQDPSSMKIGYGCWNIPQLRSLLEGQAQSEPPFRVQKGIKRPLEKQTTGKRPRSKAVGLACGLWAGRADFIQIPPLLLWETVLAGCVW